MTTFIDAGGAAVTDYLTGGARNLDVLAPATRAPYMDWSQRYDLYYDTILFARPPVFAPAGRYEALRDARTGKAVRTVHIAEYRNTKPRLLRHSLHVRNVIGALFQWHQMTSGQLACHMGVPRQSLARVLRPMFLAGLVERAQFGQPPETRGKFDTIYQLHYGEPLHRWLGQFNNEDWAAITTALKAEAAPSYSRHNLLVAELALRIAETAEPVGAVFGERLSAAARFLNSAHAAGDDLRGDALIVRPDGLRIIIELAQNQSTRDIERKLARWSKHLARNKPRDGAAVVVFLNAAAGDRHAFMAANLRRAHAAALSPEGLGTAASPATAAQVNNARASVFIANWTDWFPYPHMAHAEFAQLAVGYLKAGTKPAWGRVNLLGDQPNTVVAPGAGTADRVNQPIKAAPFLHCVPSWLTNTPEPI